MNSGEGSFIPVFGRPQLLVEFAGNLNEWVIAFEFGGMYNLIKGGECNVLFGTKSGLVQEEEWIDTG